MYSTIMLKDGTGHTVVGRKRKIGITVIVESEAG
jgi:hypothetical protein